ncbi:nuclear transport factor 2 family protein [Shewanella sp. Isolate11]|uniref:nuclear transport factor 2 family protein n=1 Tax=Shewanella sp. Isolate11 TaxID=2908530 RepID=UPI001EFC35E1|nr:nuclear transport factor 2 family protein [Shewanella sp. Isolate11]MCG9697222.1 nuclear transport factor 2 family protein [Shewanella sp. Isolate11]
MFVHSSILKKSQPVKLSRLLLLLMFTASSHAGTDTQQTVATQAQSSSQQQITSTEAVPQKTEPQQQEAITENQSQQDLKPQETVQSDTQPEAAPLTVQPAKSVMPISEEQRANEVLDNLHLYAAQADWDNYFALYGENAIFIGTDASEYWKMDQFEEYARPTKGWHYTLIERKTVRHGNVIVFDELLDSKSYGISRGTGSLLLTDKGWKIIQYHLSFPIPNDVAKKITSQIKAVRDK